MNIQRNSTHLAGKVNLPVVIAIIIAVIALLSMIFILPNLKKASTEVNDTPQEVTTTDTSSTTETPTASSQQDAVATETTTEAFNPNSPKALLEGLARALSEEGVDAFAALLEPGAVSSEDLIKLKELEASKKLTLNQEKPIQEIGELQQNRAYRWAINLQDAKQRVIVDTFRKSKDHWVANTATVKSSLTEGSLVDDDQIKEMDLLEIARLFVDSVVSQDFEQARKLTDSEKVSDSKIAALCILFEEGEFKLREEKPIRLVFKRSTVSAFLAKVVNLDESHAGEFGIVLNKKDQWKVSEVNVDALINKYTEKKVDDEVYYSPLVKNPKGGDTMALFFAYDDDQLRPRTKKQLAIVGNLLKTKGSRQLKIIGHTDAMGTTDYNDNLSMYRAISVKNALIEYGVPASQIIIEGLGENAPIMPNFKEDGSDNPLGRQKNRRAEIFLDF